MIVFSGCTTLHVNLAYVPEESRKSPLGTLKPMEVAIQIQDQRYQKDERWVGADRRGIGGDMYHEIKADKNVTTVLYDGLKRELERNGHRVVDEKDPAEWTVHVGLRKYWSEQGRDPWKLEELIGTIIADITLREGRNGDSAILTKPIESVFIVSNHLLRRIPWIIATGLVSFGISAPFHIRSVIKDSHQQALNGALAEFVRHFSRDPRILEALRSAQQKREGEPEADDSKALR